MTSLLNVDKQVRGMQSAESDVGYFEIDAVFSGQLVEMMIKLSNI